MIAWLVAKFLDDPYERGYRQGFEDVRAAIECEFPHLLRKAVEAVDRKLLAEENEWKTGTRRPLIKEYAIDFRIQVRKEFGTLIHERCITKDWKPKPYGTEVQP